MQAVQRGQRESASRTDLSVAAADQVRQRRRAGSTPPFSDSGRKLNVDFRRRRPSSWQGAALSVTFRSIVPHEPSIALVGLTPGRGQAAMAFGAAKSAVEDGATPRELLERVGRQAAFGGPMRTVLVRRLDGIGLPTALGVQSTGELFAGANSLVHMTSALRYTTLRDGKNYGGRSSEVGSLPSCEIGSCARWLPSCKPSRARW
jgi:hypothetical protein